MASEVIILSIEKAKLYNKKLMEAYDLLYEASEIQKEFMNPDGYLEKTLQIMSDLDEMQVVSCNGFDVKIPR